MFLKLWRIEFLLKKTKLQWEIYNIVANVSIVWYVIVAVVQGRYF